MYGLIIAIVIILILLLSKSYGLDETYEGFAHRGGYRNGNWRNGRGNYNRGYYPYNNRYPYYIDDYYYPTSCMNTLFGDTRCFNYGFFGWPGIW